MYSLVKGQDHETHKNIAGVGHLSIFTARFRLSSVVLLATNMTHNDRMTYMRYRPRPKFRAQVQRPFVYYEFIM